MSRRPYKLQRTTSVSKAQVLKIVRANADKRQATSNLRQTVSTTGNMDGVVNMTRGDNFLNQYGGSWVDWMWMRFRMLTVTADTFDTVRVIIIQWKGLRPPTATPDIVLDISGAVEPVLAPYNGANKQLFNVLSDTTVCVNANTPPEFAQTIFIPGKRLLKTHFNRSTDTVLSNGFYVVAVSNSFATPHPTLEWSMEAWFSDDV